LLQLIITIGLIGFFLIQAGINSSQLIFKELQKQMLQQVRDQLSQRMETAEHLNQMHSDLMQHGILELESSVERERYFVSYIKSYQDVAMTFIGLPDGSFYGARRTIGGEIQVVRNNSTTKGASWYYRIASAGEGVELVDQFPNFDPRIRPWYTKAVEVGAPVFSSVYSHFVFREPTITASHPVYDQNHQLIGVFGVDYLLSWLGDTLGSLPIGPSGQVFVTDNTGMLIATSFDSPSYKVVEGVSQLIPAKESDSALVQASLNLHENEYDKRLPRFTIDGKKYFVAMSSYQEHGVNWNVYVISAEDDFLGGVKQAVINTAIILAASLLISVFLMFWIGLRVTKPIVALSKAADELTRGRLMHIPENGREDEIGVLTRAFNEMGLRLTNIVVHLEEEVATRTQELKERNEELRTFNELRETFIDADSSFVFLKDEYLKYVFVNKALKEFFQLSYDDIIGHDDFELAEEAFAKMCTNADLDILDQHRLITTTTTWNNRFFRTTKFPVRMLNNTFGVGAYITDITEEYELERSRERILETLAYERNKYLQTLMSIGDGVMVIDRNENIEILNMVACRLTGWQLDEAIGINYKEVFNLSHEQKGFTVDDPIEKVFMTSKIHELGNHAILTSKNGTKYHLEDSAAPIMDDKGSLAGVVLVFRDVTEKKEQRKKIEYMSFHDSLTGLYNRRFFEEELRRIDTESNLPISIIMGDVNSLKLTNDIFGHAFGDILLERITEVMQGACRSDDIIARWGGDEFVLLLPRTSSEEAERIAGRIKKDVSEQRIRAVKGSISLGYDTKTHPTEDIVRVLSSAEAKMYTTKSLERDDTLSHELENLVNAFFEKSKQEEEHAIRVSRLCQKLGKALNLSKSSIQMLMEAGRLHDIGKIALEPGLLKKGHHLSTKEWNEINQHPVIGYRILNSFDNTLELAEAVLSHHENWDGSGYPKGLKGEKIPLLARIISIAESYDYMVHVADNITVKCMEEAIQEIHRCAGTQFDPMIAEAFIGMINSGDDEYMQ